MTLVNSLDPSCFIWPISEAIPHDRLVVPLSVCVSFAIPFGWPIDILAIIINHKVAITLED